MSLWKIGLSDKTNQGSIKQSRFRKTNIVLGQGETSKKGGFKRGRIGQGKQIIHRTSIARSRDKLIVNVSVCCLSMSNHKDSEKIGVILLNEHVAEQ